MKKDTSASFKCSTVLPWVEMRIASQSSACYNAHSHDEFSFGIIEQGRALYRNRNRTHQIGMGDIVTINPADVHSCNPEAGLWSYNMLFVDTEQMGIWQQEVLSAETGKTGLDYTPFNADLERNTEIKQRYQSLFSALKNDASLLEVQSCFYDFLHASLARYEPSKVTSAPSSAIKRVKEKLLDQIAFNHELEALSSEAGMSRYQLLRAFKHQYGLPPHAYLMDEKIKRAKVMLKSGQEIAQVAYELGFTDQAHFQKHFKKRIAVTPKYYQSHFVKG
ncbi:MAG: AraC family transcriptional regulator [Vibrionaceae bacterium]|nr:AraC family transcriptional regulator [Vibrionaceae bacterium]